MATVREDVVIVGGGIAGAGLAVVLARAGLGVLVLERQPKYRDRVRGEFMPPWGYRELHRAGLLDIVMQAEGTVAARAVTYDELMPPDVAEKRAANLGTVLPGVPGGIALSHPGACQALSEAAVAAGARVAQGITGVRVTAGDPPRLRYRDGDADRAVEARLVVGADGRSSVVRRQVGIPLYGDGPRTFGAGLLVESLDGWPAGMYSVGTWRDVLHYVFPRRDGRTRLYLCWGKHDAARFAGPRGAGAFLDCFASLACLPDPDAFRRVEPIGPCASYPFGDTRTVRPYVEGAVLIGDAAGYNDPIIGQGLSLAIRDVRAVSEVLLGSPRWTATMFEDYAAERAERMRRLSATATAFTRLRCTFTDEGRRRRGAAFARFAADPASLAPLLAAAIGPEELPPEAFEPAAADRMLAL